jgi:hypothetical protein
MKRTFLFLLFPFLFNYAMAQRNGVVSIARYNGSAPPMLDASDGLPEFEGGMDAFKKAFKLEFTFPASALESEEGGEGMIGLTIDTLGHIHDVEVIDAISPEIDAEAVSVISAMHQFQPMWKPMKIAVLYRAYPSVYKDEQYNKRLDTLIESRKPSEWRNFVDKKKSYLVFSAQVGATIPTDALNRNLRPFIQIGGNLEAFKDRWGGGLTGTLRASTIRKDFENNKEYWDKDSSVSLHSVGLYAAYRLVEEDRLTFTPFVGFSANFLLLTAQTYDYTPSIVSFLPTIGATVDLTRKQNPINDGETIRLNTTIFRFRFAANFANFEDGRRGNIVDFGIGIGWFSRRIVVK